MNAVNPVQSADMPDILPLSARTCDGCTLCCRLPDIDELDKPANLACRHCVEGKGCAQYDTRPKTCRDFLCLWRTDADFGPEWQPSLCGMMLYRQGPQMTVLVDPESPAALQAGCHADGLQQLAERAEAAGGYVVVFVGDAVFKVEAG